MPRTETIRTSLRLHHGVLLAAQGVNHFVNEAFFVSIMPDYLPWHRELVWLSGVAEVAIGLGMLAPRPALLRLSGWAAIALFLAIFPANIHMAMHPERYKDLPPVALYVRLPVQGVFLLWAWWTCLRDPRVRGDAP